MFKKDEASMNRKGWTGSKAPWIKLSGFVVMGLLAVLAWVGGIPSARASDHDPTNNAGTYQFRLGEFQVATISDGLFRLPPYPTFATNADLATVEQAMVERFWAPDELLVYLNATYVDTGEHKVLIDTGAGIEFGEGLAQLPDNLRKMGVDPEDIDTVILTHAHADHIGGIVNTEGELNFPNAQYHISTTEWEFWTAEEVDLSPLNVSDEMKQSFIAAANKHLGAIADRVSLFDPGQEIIPGLTAIAAPGHTPGQAVIQIASGDALLTVTADVFFNQAFHLAYPEWQVAFDLDPEEAVTTRRQILDQVAEQKSMVLAFHLPFPGVGYVRARDDRYEWEPVLWEFDPA